MVRHRVLWRYLRLYFEPLPAFFDRLGRLQAVLIGLVLLGVGLASKIQRIGALYKHVPGGTPTVILISLLILALVAGLRLAAGLESVKRNLDLYIEVGGTGAAMATFHGSIHGIYMLGDLLIVNHGVEKVLLRLRARIPVVRQPEPKSWHMDEEIIYASGPCLTAESGMRLASDVGEVPHLPTEMSLEHKQHVRGHTELDLDLHFMEFNYGKQFQRAPAYLEIQDILSGQIKVLDVELPDWNEVVVASIAAPPSASHTEETLVSTG